MAAPENTFTRAVLNKTVRFDCRVEFSSSISHKDGNLNVRHLSQGKDSVD